MAAEVKEREIESGASISSSDHSRAAVVRPSMLSTHTVAASNVSLPLKRKANEAFSTQAEQSPDFERGVKIIFLHRIADMRLQAQNTALQRDTDSLSEEASLKMAARPRLQQGSRKAQKTGDATNNGHEAVEEAASKGESVLIEQREGFFAQHKQKAAKTNQALQTKVEYLTAEKEMWESQHRILKERSTRTESGLRSSLTEALQRTRSLTEELGSQKLETNALAEVRTAMARTAAMRDARIEELDRISEERRFAANTLTLACQKLKVQSAELATLNQVYQQQSTILEERCEDQVGELIRMQNIREGLEGRCTELLSFAAERARLQEANARSCKSPYSIFPWITKS